MTPVVEAEVFTRCGKTVHEDIKEQVNRNREDIWKQFAEKKRQIWPESIDTNSKAEQARVVQGAANNLVFNTALSTPMFSDVSNICAEPEHGFRIFDNFLQKIWKHITIGIETKATTETSVLVSSENWMSSVNAESFTRGTEWTDEKNHRRCELVDKEIDGTISLDQQIELENLQAKMLAFRRQVAPLPLNDLRKLHEELLREAANQAE